MSREIAAPTLVLLVSTLVAGAPVSAQTFMTVTDEATGQTQVITEAGGYGLNIAGSESLIGISTIYRSEARPPQPFLSHTWYTYVVPPRGEALRPGLYPDAGCRNPQFGRAIGIEVTEENPVCFDGQLNELRGWVALRQFELDEQGRLEKLEMLLTQRFGDNPGYTVLVRHNATPMYFRLTNERGAPRSRVIGDFHGDTSFFDLAGRPDDSISYAASVPQDHWLTLIAPPTGKSLKRGRYAVAAKADAWRAGLVLQRQFEDYFDCSTLQGTLDIRDIKIDGAGVVKGVWAKYAIGCSRRPTLGGELRFGL